MLERSRIDFTEDVAFSENFILRSADELRSINEERIRQIMTADRRAFFLELKKSFPGLAFEVNGDLLLFFQRDTVIEPELETCRE